MHKFKMMPFIFSFIITSIFLISSFLLPRHTVASSLSLHPYSFSLFSFSLVIRLPVKRRENSMAKKIIGQTAFSFHIFRNLFFLPLYFIVLHLFYTCQKEMIKVIILSEAWRSHRIIMYYFLSFYFPLASVFIFC